MIKSDYDDDETKNYAVELKKQENILFQKKTIDKIKKIFYQQA